jgi:phosphoenolpyruvate carboxykinase (GTP)
MVVRLGLRRQRDPGEEVLRAAHRLGDRPQRGLARRAHAPHPRDRPRRPCLPPRRRVPVGLRQDEPRDAAPDDPRLARRDPRRRHPEAGFFGVAPGTGESTNVTAIETLWGNTIFTNVALRPDGDVWWEGLTDEPPAELTDWEGNPWTPASGRPAAHPNSRFTVRAEQCPQIAEDWDAPQGVPLDAILFGGRRATNVPLVVEATDWTHGVFMGSNISSERTAAAEGTVGELRRDPFAMLPFCGYNMADYFGHWLKVGQKLRFDRAPRVFQVNWFRKGTDGRFLWPGFGDNARVIDWIVRRLDGEVGAVESPIGRLPHTEDLDLDGIDVPQADLDELFAIDPQLWSQEADLTEEFYRTFDGRVPAPLWAELAALRYRLQRA